MSRDVLVSLLEAVVFPDVVQIISADNDGTGHLHFLYHSCQDTSPDVDVPGEWAFLVNICALNGLEY